MASVYYPYQARRLLCVSIHINRFRMKKHLVYMTNLKNVPVKSQYGQKRVALPKPKPPTLLHGKPSCSHPSPAFKVRTRNTT